MSALPAHASASPLAADLPADVEPVDPKLADVNVESGKDRPLLGARLELGQADQADPLGGHAVDRQLVGEPRARRPVELDVGRGQEHAAASWTTETLRSCDLPKIEPSIRPMRMLSPDAVSNLPMRSTMKRWPGALSSSTKAPASRNSKRDEQRQQLIEQAPRPILAKAARRRFRAAGDDRRFSHRQNAWPSDTVTATGPSPFSRFSGTPTSMRIGPKLE